MLSFFAFLSILTSLFSLLLMQASSVAALLDGGVSGTPLAAASIVCVAQSPAVDVVAVGLR